MENSKHFVIDFDSTFTRVEALDVLGEISLKNHTNKSGALKKVKDITDLGMEGKLSFRESLEQRIETLQANKSHLPELVDKLSAQVSKSFIRNKEFIRKYSSNI
ncbi:MAG: phosphoglycerate dehydrogenase, partial [Cyclobacteriaceae bacterium]